MLRFLIRRLLTGALVIIMVTIAVFALFFLAPTNPALLLLGKFAGKDPQLLATVTHQLGLDQPFYEQYWHFLLRLLHGDLGFSYYSHEPVTSILSRALPETLSLAIGAAIIWLVFGVLIGVLSATRPRTIWDRGATAFALTGISFPTFVLGNLLLLILFFEPTQAGFTLFPAGGYVPLSQGVGQWALHMILPWVTLAVVTMATYVRLTRGQMLEVLGEDYIRTARSKGLRSSRVTYRHGLRAALVPVITQFGIDIGGLLGGVVVTEQVFGINGLGKLSLTSVIHEDEPVIIAIVLLAAIFVVLANIIVDMFYAVLDPRVRLA